MRRTIAERITASYQQAPHIGFTWRNDMTKFNEARAQLNARAEKVGSPRISATALIVKIVGSVLARHPWLNASFQGEEIHLYRDIHIGMAVALETGLIVPVVRNVGDKGVSEIAAEVKDLSLRARDGELLPAEVRGGTFTISNLGPFGVEQFNAIINPPEAAILAIGATQNEAVASEDGHVVVRPMMNITLSADHRVVDGAVAAHFIADLKAALEAPVLLLM
jgi:pyruvate dehydrogenase E2 component (dihydrolipoamide acetyltransferase)